MSNTPVAAKPTQTPESSILGVAIALYAVIQIAGSLGQVGICEHRARTSLQCQPAWSDYYDSLDKAGALFLALMARFPAKGLMDAMKRSRGTPASTPEPAVRPATEPAPTRRRRMQPPAK